MTVWKRSVLVVALMAMSLPGIAQSSEVEILMNKLVERGILSSVDAEAIRTEIAQSKTENNTQLAKDIVPQWTQRISLGGDLRLRNEYRDRSNNSDGNRQRIRFRLGMKADVSPELQVGARFVTGSAPGDLNESSDPVSTNQTMSDTFAKKNFNLDHAYVRYSPETPLGSVKAWGGLFDNPFLGTSLVWDQDLSFAGAAIQLSHGWGPVAVVANSGIFPIDSDGFGVDNPALFGVQGGLIVTPELKTNLEVIDHLKVTSVLSYYDYTNSVKNPLVNTQGGNTASAEDFNEVNPYLEVSSMVFGGMPVSFWTDFVNNTAAPEQATGYQFGLKLNQAKTPWSLTDGWEVGYFYERLDAEAAFDGFVDSDFGGGGTNHQGNVWWVNVATLKNSTAGLKFFHAKEVKGAKNHEDRIQMDWATKF